MTPEQQKIKELEAKLQQMQSSLDQAKAQITDLQAQKGILYATYDDYVRLILECLAILKEKFPTDAEFQKEVWHRIEQSCSQSARNMSCEKFLKRVFCKRSERTQYPSAKQVVEAATDRFNQIKPKVRGLEKRCAQMGNALTVAGKAVQKAAAKSDDESLKDAAFLAEYARPQTEEKTNGQSLGRQALPFDRNEEETPDATVQCSCGNKTDFIAGTVMQSAVRELENHAQELVKTVCSRYQQVQCRKCGRVHLVYHDDSMPVTPKSTMGLSSTVAAAVLYADGIPLNKVEKMLFGKDSKLGNETLGRNVHKLSQDYLKPMVTAFVEAMNGQYALVADETVIKVLQSQGHGPCEPAEDTREQDYLAAVCSPYYETKRAVVFNHLGGRGAKVIGENLSKYSPKAWVTDAYSAYDSYCDEGGLIHQCCWIHLKRELLDAVNIDSLVKSLNCKTDDEAIKRATKEMKLNADVYKLCCVIQGVSKLFGYEKMVKRDWNKPIEDYFDAVRDNRNKHAKVLVERIDKILAALAEKYTEKKGSKYVGTSRNNQMCKALTYYMNHRENFKKFVEDPQIPLDSNAVEASIRPVAVLRKASEFKQSVEYTESLCTLLSVTETAKANGLNTPIEWLTDYAKAYFLHRASNTLTKAVNENGRSLDSKLMEFDEGSEAGFDIEPWLPWNYVKR